MKDIKRIKGKTVSADPVKGDVYWSARKSLWVTSLYLVSIIGGYLFFSWSALLLFLAFTAFTICAGHSVGMHRRLIHNSFECPKGLEYFLVHLGCLVGLGGPLSMTYTHDLRDWAQRQVKCHDYFAHRNSFFRDAYWQMHCDVTLDKPPVFEPEPELVNDKVYQWMEKTWMLQQLPWAILFFVMGGLPWLIWGIGVRTAVSITGHWLVGYYAHRGGQRYWHVKGAGVQGYNIKYLGLITMGECWHNNHHSYPESAKIGLHQRESDPGWRMIQVMEKLGLAWNIKQGEACKTSGELKRL